MKTALSIGQCGFDNGSICQVIERLGARLETADGLSDALALLTKNSIDLILVNRKLDADGSDGLAVIRGIKAEQAAKEIPLMLVSNYAEAHDAAQKVGAVRGFGKDSLFDTTTTDLLKRYLA